MSDAKAPLTDYDRKLIEAFDAYTEAGNERAAARALGLNRTTMTNRLLRYFLRGLDGKLPMRPLPGHVVKSISQQFDADGQLVNQFIKTGAMSSEDLFEVPDGHRVKGESALVDAEGNVIQKWIKTAEGERSLEVIEEAARIAAERYAGPAVPLARPSRVALDDDLLNLFVLPDLHIGAHLNMSTAEMNWDLPTAISTYKRLFADLVARAPKAHTAVILGGGDLLHADDDTRMTRRSGNLLEVAEPYAVVLAEAELLLVYKAELALQTHEKVIIRVLAGNHDPDSAVAISHFLKAWFRNEPRVEVDIDPSLFWFYEFGDVMLGATHGHETKINQMPGIMAADRAPVWGRTVLRYAHGFHIHHATRSSGEEAGASWETHETPVPRDTYHQGKNYRSRRSLPVITYDRNFGEVGRTLARLTCPKV